MTMDARQMESAIQELLEFLDASADSVQQMLNMLSELRAALIRRDEPALRLMQDALPQIAAEKQQNELHLRQICRKFAMAMDCPAEQINLTRLAAALPVPQQSQVLKKQQSLQSLVNRLSVEHRGTESLLRECERLNRLLLTSILGKRNQTLTYTSTGQSRRELHRSIVSMRM